MYNSTMMLPFYSSNAFNGVITYIAMSTGIVAKTFAYASWNMFCPIGGLIDTMDVKALIIGLRINYYRYDYILTIL